MSRWKIQAPARRPVAAPDVSQALDTHRKVLSDLAAHPLMEGELIEGVVLADEVTTAVRHKLSRPFVGWLIVDEVGGLTPGRIRRLTGGNDAQEIILRAYGFGETVSVSLMVF